MPRRKPHLDQIDEVPPEEVTTIPPPVVQPAAQVGEELPSSEVQRFKRVLAEMLSRRCEALRLYEPLPIIDAFHRDRRPERLLRGSNRAGKTLGAAVEFARMVTGQDPYQKYPAENGIAYAIGLDEHHLGEVMYRKLFRAGAFKMIRDAETGDWRAFRPATDEARKQEAKPAPPLIPRRFVKHIAWKSKKENIPKTVTLINGWEMTFFSSKGAEPQGSAIDGWWIDEEIENETFYTELAARCLDRSGIGFWSATPQIASQQLYDLHVRAEQGDPDVGEHHVLLEDNPHISRTEKDKFYSRCATDEERRVRIGGEFAIAGFKVYPDFSTNIHVVELDGPVPATWCRYVAIDPGRQVCAALFLAVPPPPEDYVLLYDELYIKNCDAHIFGLRFSEKTRDLAFELFLIDGHAGRVTEMGSGRTIESQYSEQLKKHRIESRRSGHGFAWGADDPLAGIEAVRGWLRIRAEDNRPRLRVAAGRLPNFIWEVQRYHYKRTKGLKGIVSDMPEKKHDHLMDCLRYLAMANPKYKKPPKGKTPESYAVRALKSKRERKARREGPGYVRLGPGR